MEVEPRYKLLTLHTLIPQLHVCPHTYFYMVRAPTEYGGSTVLTLLALFTLFLLYSNCFALLICIYSLLGKIGMQWKWANWVLSKMLD